MLFLPHVLCDLYHCRKLSDSNRVLIHSTSMLSSPGGPVVEFGLFVFDYRHDLDAKIFVLTVPWVYHHVELYV